LQPKLAAYLIYPPVRQPHFRVTKLKRRQMSYTAEGGICRKFRRETLEGRNRERLKKDMCSVMNQRRRNAKG
jgi:hypothetical protein